MGKFNKFGDSPLSLSWNDKDSQYLRFQKISNLFKYDENVQFSIHEVGCGLAHFKDFLDSKTFNAIYSGNDIVEEFIVNVREKYPSCEFFIQNIANDLEEIEISMKNKDYYILNGTFHTKEENSIQDWEFFVFKTIKNMFDMSKKGICVNFLTSYSDFYDDKLYYADPKVIIDWCVNNLSRFISVEHDIPLYEFFVYIYKEKFIKEKFPFYSKYFKEIV